MQNIQSKEKQEDIKRTDFDKEIELFKQWQQFSIFWKTIWMSSALDRKIDRLIQGNVLYRERRMGNLFYFGDEMDSVFIQQVISYEFWKLTKSIMFKYNQKLGTVRLLSTLSLEDNHSYFNIWSDSYEGKVEKEPHLYRYFTPSGVIETDKSLGAVTVTITPENQYKPFK